MDYELLRDYYLREDIQNRILHFSKDREVAFRFDDFFGKRPQVIENKIDLLQIRKKLPTSFHCSEERWLNAHLLGTEKNEQERNKNRIGWDLLLDLDGVDYEYARIAGDIILRFLKKEGVKNTTVKFSGNKGFHIVVPYESFVTQLIPYNGKNYDLSELFPQFAQYMALYITEQIKGELSQKLIESAGSIDELSKKWDIPLSDLVNSDKEAHNLNFLKLIEIDTILITSRHLFRMPYSLHEKSGLASIPINPDTFLEFDKLTDADPKVVDPKKYEDFEFLSYKPEFGKDAWGLQEKVIEKLDDYLDDGKLDEKFLKELKELKIHRGPSKAFENNKTTFLTNAFGEVFEIDQEVEYEDFSHVIKEILQMDFEDGKKRAVFVLLTFFYSIKWDEELIYEQMKEWNSKQSHPLKEQYIRVQMTWFNNQANTISPPNYTSENYYKNIGIPKEIIEKDVFEFNNKRVKNPLHYVYLKLKTKPQGKKGKTKGKK